MRRQRILGAGVLAVALTAFLGGPARAADGTTVTVVGPSGGVVAHCPAGLRPGPWTLTNGDGSPLGPGQRWDWTVTGGETGIGAWIAPYDHSPPPPVTIRLTLTCIC